MLGASLLLMAAIIGVVVLGALLLAWVVVRRKARVEADETMEARPIARPAPGAGLGERIRGLFGAEGGDPWSGLEELLVRADVGPATASRIVGDVRPRYRQGMDPSSLVGREVEEILGEDQALELPSERLGIVMIVGVNGSGKTTTIGKLASRLAAQGKAVSLAGSDTFRAAASEQLEVWAERAGAHLVSQERGADPGSVAFDAVRSAQARASDVLIVDTAGRLHTKEPLMEELRKVRRVIEKAAGRAPDETLLVMDATTGQNGIAQARAFTDAVEVTGVVLAKLDGTAKGGIVLSVKDQLGVPVKLVGTGEGIGDLEPFERTAFARRLLGE
ncbi:MAG TPA: signal recognition particle-docking protein FtsY [Actinomycetota bacterium]|nr:signal recognition particle-docking protein FtsY [Actinomycetota bacterium]